MAITYKAYLVLEIQGSHMSVERWEVPFLKPTLLDWKRLREVVGELEYQVGGPKPRAVKERGGGLKCTR